MIFTTFSIPTFEISNSKILENGKNISPLSVLGKLVEAKNCHALFFNFALASPAPYFSIPTPKALNSETLVECKHISINCGWKVGGSILKEKICCDIFFNAALLFNLDVDNPTALAKSTQVNKLQRSWSPVDGGRPATGSGD
ncbi:unnamed protein product [Prunus armeniaca]